VCLIQDMPTLALGMTAVMALHIPLSKLTETIAGYPSARKKRNIVICVIKYFLNEYHIQKLKINQPLNIVSESLATSLKNFRYVAALLSGSRA